MQTVIRTLAVLAAFTAAPLLADTKLGPLFGDNMVLQREKPVVVWGWDEPGSEVAVTLGEASAKATAGKDGKWTVSLPEMKAGGPHSMTIAGSSTATLKNILVGEVWLCSGQSNMEWTVARSANAQEEIAAAKYPQIRHIKFAHTPAAEPQNDAPNGGWQETTPETVPGFTAVGYYFGRKLHEELDVPIGLIGSNWGGTRIEPWTPPVGFQQVEALSDIADNLQNFPQKNAEGKINHQSALALYNGMIHPLVPYSIRGALWYQGESNNGEGMLYHEKMKALIGGWRKVWGDSDMPFYFVQLAPYRYRDPAALPHIWEAQAATLAVPHTGMAVTTDISNLANIHPTNKQDVGGRLARWALAKDYGQDDLVYSGPLYKSMEIEGGKIRLTFDHAAGLKSSDDQPLSWFEIAGKDKNFVLAEAQVDGDTLVVSSPDVKAPVAVRFGWNQDAEPNFVNGAGLPASPFRTDKW
ncbi:sialate O-acetylesterase [Lignipirellula cremea]|uniref:Sialate O-acetylesterase domain-containing protein n=1 Tax=Lignipirellula cremea TaxID=2528010 RepID=A0A518DPZ2_9BACT|nr:sialate O-acetylesterase [Lignipirellula cremea]QDU93916.1 hypothetical protein Pla8534_17020 [Lignipirellula cremea]